MATLTIAANGKACVITRCPSGVSLMWKGMANRSKSGATAKAANAAMAGNGLVSVVRA
jgi:hypothetical protein